MKRAIQLLTICFLVVFHSAAFGQPGSGAPEIGPENGSLVIIGGGVTTSEILNKIIELMGGADQPLVVVPTANVPTSINIAATRQQWINTGFSDVTVLHTTDPAEADTDEFVEPLRRAKCVWFGGGRQWRYVDAYWNTKTFDEFHNVLARGGVIAGSSAGASIQASFLARGAESSNTIMIAPEPEHQVGFGFIRNCAIDQHADARDRWTDMYEIIESFPELLGFSIAESTAMVVQGDCFEVIGRGQVAVHDSTRLFNCETEICYSILEPGDVFNLKAREAGSCLETSVAEPIARRNVTLYPNPTEGFIHFATHSGRPAVVNVSDIYGRVVQRHAALNLADQSLDVTALPAGVYFVEIRDGGQKMAHKIVRR